MLKLQRPNPWLNHAIYCLHLFANLYYMCNNQGILYFNLKYFLKGSVVAAVAVESVIVWFKAPKVKGKVNKLDMNKDGKITSADFAMLRGKKKKKK